MSENSNQTSVARDINNVSDFPVAAIVCLLVGGYVMLVMIFLVVRRLLVSKGIFQSHCCCPQSLPTCCGKLAEVCQSCSCHSCCEEGCLRTFCVINKETKCKDIFCCCCGCQQGCCDSCTGVCPASLSCCHQSAKCCACDSHCLSCFDNDLDPDACGCLCLEIKLRTARSSSSVPPTGRQNLNINADVSLDDVSNHVNMYHTGKLNGSIADRTLDKNMIGNGSIRERQGSSSHSPAKTASHFHQMLPDKLNAFNASDTPEGHNSVHVSFTKVQDESNARHKLQQRLSPSTVFSSSAPEALLTKSSMNRTGSSEMAVSQRSLSRSRRIIRAGQISQRFPNKILVSSEPLNFGRMNKMDNVMPEISLTPNFEKSLSNVVNPYDAVNLRRPLPPLKRTV
ncbi:hypothetical protein BsWGS_21808 [Bradybaena similaris]